MRKWTNWNVLHEQTIISNRNSVFFYSRKHIFIYSFSVKKKKRYPTRYERLENNRDVTKPALLYRRRYGPFYILIKVVRFVII